MKNEPSGEPNEQTKEQQKPATYRERLEAQVRSRLFQEASDIGATYLIVEALAFCIVDEMDRRRAASEVVGIKDPALTQEELDDLTKGPSFKRPTPKKG